MVADAGAAERLLGGIARSGREGAVNACRRYDPGHDVQTRYPDWVVRHRPLRGPRELLCWRRQVILIASELDWAGKRSSLAHALAHIDLGHRTRATMDLFGEREEMDADRLASRRLISLDELVAVAPWTQHPAEMLEHFDVDAEMLRVRLAHLTDAERDALADVMARRDEPA